MSTRKQVYAVIDSERNHQIDMAEKAHGDPCNDRKKSLEEFALYMDDYVREMKTQLSRTWGLDAYRAPLDTIRKITAVGVAAMEVWGAQPRTVATKHEHGTDLT